MDQEGRYVLVINEANKIQRQLVRIGTSHGDWTVIADGLAEGDRVVVIGLQKVKPGDEVEANPVTDPPPMPTLRSHSGPEPMTIDIPLDSK
jgi:membrane fusion protein (multidrug efflux system)